MNDFERPVGNDKSIHSSDTLKGLFEDSIPSHVEGFELSKEHAKKMADTWPAGEQAAHKALSAFVDSKSKEHGMPNYKENRNRPDLNGTSRMSPYIACETSYT